VTEGATTAAAGCSTNTQWRRRRRWRSLPASGCRTRSRSTSLSTIITAASVAVLAIRGCPPVPDPSSRHLQGSGIKHQDFAAEDDVERGVRLVDPLEVQLIRAHVAKAARVARAAAIAVISATKSRGRPCRRARRAPPPPASARPARRRARARARQGPAPSARGSTQLDESITSASESFISPGRPLGGAAIMTRCRVWSRVRRSWVARMSWRP